MSSRYGVEKRDLVCVKEEAGLCASRAFVHLGKRELVCVLLVHLFVCFVPVSFVILLFLLVPGLADVCDCGTPWTFLLTFCPI